MEPTKETKDGKKIARDKCPNCGGTLEYLGATIGATQLKGCLKCRRVFWVNTQVYIE